MIMPLASLGNFFGADGLMIFVVILLLFGAKKLPELARGLGQSLNEFKKARDDFEHELHQAQADPQAREAGNRQVYAGAPVTPPTQALPYNAPLNANVAPPAESAEALRLKVDQLQQQLREIEAEKNKASQAPV